MTVEQSPDWDLLFDRIKRRYASLTPNTDQITDFVQHVKSLGEDFVRPENFNVDSALFTDRLWVAYAVCHPDCGVKELIVEGSTQECQYCGRLMYRMGTAEYAKVPGSES